MQGSRWKYFHNIFRTYLYASMENIVYVAEECCWKQLDSSGLNPLRGSSEKKTWQRRIKICFLMNLLQWSFLQNVYNLEGQFYHLTLFCEPCSKNSSQPLCLMQVRPGIYVILHQPNYKGWLVFLPVSLCFDIFTHHYFWKT